MYNYLSNILLRQEGNGGGGTLTTEPTTQIDFDVEKVKASGLFVPKEDFEAVKTNLQKEAAKLKDKLFQERLKEFDDFSQQIAELTGIERIVKEENGKKVYEPFGEYSKRAFSTKLEQPNEREEKLKKLYTEKELHFKKENESLKQELLNLRYDNELSTAINKHLIGYQDEEKNNATEILKALVLTKYSREYDPEKGFIYKDSKGEIVTNKNLDTITTAEIVAEAAKLLPTKQSQTPKVKTDLGSPKQQPQKVTLDTIVEMVLAEGLTISNPAYFERLKELRKQYNV